MSEGKLNHRSFSGIKEYLAAALCPGGSDLAPADGHVARTEAAACRDAAQCHPPPRLWLSQVVPGRLEATIWAATVQDGLEV